MDAGDDTMYANFEDGSKDDIMKEVCTPEGTEPGKVGSTKSPIEGPLLTS